MASPYTYTVAVKDNIGLIDIDTSKSDSSNAISQMTLRDSLFDLYPTGSFVFNDDKGGLYSDATHIEGLPMSARMVIQDRVAPIALSHDVYWSGQGLVSPTKSDHIGGKTLMKMTSKFRTADEQRPFFYTGTAASAVSTIMAKFSALPPAVPPIPPQKPQILKTLVTPTQGSRIWYQGDRTYMELVADMADYALDTTNPFSPFCYFFNLASEFRFQSVSGMLLQPAIPTLKYILDFSNPNVNFDINYVQDYSQVFLSSEVNDDVYKITNYWTNATDQSLSLPNDITKIQMQADPVGSLPLRRFFGNQKNSPYLGIYDAQSVPFKQALENKPYLDTLLGIRLNIKVYQNPDAVSGRTVYITTPDIARTPTTPLNLQYSGLWLIVESSHEYLMDPSTGGKTTFSNLSLARSSVQVKDPKQYLQAKA